MAVDILNYPNLLKVEEQLLGTPDAKAIGAFGFGDELSRLIGSGQEIDGIRDYMPGDEARHIDWVHTAKRTDGKKSYRQHYDDKTSLTVVVSDIPRHDRYAETLGNPVSARTLGFVAVHYSLESAQGNPMLALWSDGIVRKNQLPRALDGPRAAVSFMEDGLQLASESTKDYREQLRDAQKRRFGKKARNSEQEQAQEEPFSEVIANASVASRSYADSARFIIVSDFRSDTDAVIDELALLNSTSDVVAVQITNPLLRELPAGINIIGNSSTSKNGIIDSNQKRAIYAEKAQQRQVQIDEALALVTTARMKVDTADPELANLLVA